MPGGRSGGLSARGRLVSLGIAAILAGTAGLVWLARSAERARPAVAPAAGLVAPAGPASAAHAAEGSALPLQEPGRSSDTSIRAPSVPVASRNETPSAAAARGSDLARAYELLRADDLRARFEGLRLLAELRPLEAVPEILAFLEASRDGERVLLQRLAAVALLGELEGVSTAAELKALYERSAAEGDEGLRRAAACALEAQGDPSLVERELAALRGALAHPDEGERARAVERVGALASRSTIPVLLPLLQDPNSAVRALAIDGLWRADDPSIVPELERLRADPIARVRERAERAILALQASAGAARAR